MLNSKLLLILLINFVLLAINFLFFKDNFALFFDNDRADKVQSEAKSVTLDLVDNNLAPVPPLQFSPIAPLSLSVGGKMSDREARLRQENRQKDKKLALLAERLTQAEGRNKSLAGQIENLNHELAIRNHYISGWQENNRQLAQRSSQPSLLASEADLLKTGIQSQPDLVHLKSPKKSIDQVAAEIEMLGSKESIATDEALFGDLSGAVEFGFTYEQDNKKTRSLNGRLILNYEKTEVYKLNSNFKFELEKEDRNMSSEKYRWQLQADHYLDPRNLIFARSDIQHSQFASYDREDIYTLGYGRVIFEQNKHKFDIEIGPGYRMASPNNGEDAVSIDEFIVRTGLNYERVVSDSLQLMANAVLEMGNENSIYQVNFKAQNKIYRELYLIFDFEYKFTQTVPVDTVNKEILSGFKVMYAF